MADSALQSLSAGSANFESSETHSETAQKERGPFRPEAWINTRQREALRLRVFLYRGIDILLVVGLTLTWLVEETHPAPITQISMGEALPYILGGFCILALSRSFGLYSFNRTRSVLTHAAMTIGTVMIAVAPSLAVAAILEDTSVSDVVGWSALTGFLLGGLHLIWSSLINAGRLSGALIPNIVLIGANSDAEKLIERARVMRDMNIIAVFDDRVSRVPDFISGVPVLGHIDDLIGSRLAPYIDTIAVMIEPDAYNRIKDINRKLQTLPNHVMVFLSGSDRGKVVTERAVRRLARTPVAMISGSVNRDRSAFFKRMLDLVLSVGALIVLSPLLLLVGLLVRLDSPGPALFKQHRHGFNHEVITVWKFRTMRHADADATAARQVVADDDRVTRIGRFLRLSSIDELPQLINVVRGEMSLVGPRPHAIGMKTGSVASSAIVADYAYRHRIKPGLTGWAAINGSRGPLHTASEVRKRVQLDIEYIDRQSLWFDVMIILRTIPVLLGDRLAIR